MQYRKTIISSIFIALLAISGVGAAFAQEDAPDTEDNAPFCVPAQVDGMERGDRDPVAALLAIGVTQAEIDAARDADTFDELLETYSAEIDAAREAAQAEREAAHQAALLDCVTNAEAEGLITADEAAALTEAIENDTFREFLEESDGAFDGIFPQRNRGDRDGDGRRGRGNGDGDGRGNGPRGNNGERPTPPNSGGNGQPPAPEGEANA